MAFSAQHMIQLILRVCLLQRKLFHGLILLSFAGRVRQICLNLIKKEGGFSKEWHFGVFGS